MTSEIKAPDRETAIPQMKTPSGKKMVVKHIPQTALYCIEFEGGGELPENLKGMYTTTQLAHSAVESYLNARWDYSDEQAAKAKSKRTTGNGES